LIPEKLGSLFAIFKPRVAVMQAGFALQLGLNSALAN